MRLPANQINTSYKLSNERQAAVCKTSCQPVYLPQNCSRHTSNLPTRRSERAWFVSITFTQCFVRIQTVNEFHDERATCFLSRRRSYLYDGITDSMIRCVIKRHSERREVISVLSIRNSVTVARSFCQPVCRWRMTPALYEVHLWQHKRSPLHFCKPKIVWNTDESF